MSIRDKVIKWVGIVDLTKGIIDLTRVHAQRIECDAALKAQLDRIEAKLDKLAQRPQASSRRTPVPSDWESMQIAALHQFDDPKKGN